MQGEYQPSKKIFYDLQKTEKFQKLYKELLNKTNVS